MSILLGPTHKIEERTVPLIALREGVIFPHTEILLTFGRPQSIAGIDAAMTSGRLVCMVTQKNPTVEKPNFDDIYKTGTLCSVERVLKTDEEINALVRGLSRVNIVNFISSQPFFLAKIKEISETFKDSEETQALTKHVNTAFKRAVKLGKGIDFLVFMKLMSGVHPTELADQIASNLEIKNEQKQLLLEMVDVNERLKRVSDYLDHELRVLEIERTIDSKTQKKFDDTMRKAVLKERIRTIQKELGEGKEEDKEIKEYREKIKKALMPKEVAEKADKELKRLASMHTFNPEAGYIRTYLDWLVEMPWSQTSPNNVTIGNAKKVLNEDHYGLDEVKERVLEYLAVLQLKSRNKKAGKKPKSQEKIATILCFVGPPGVGKTSIGRSIARALGRKFVRVSLGGIRDEAEIRGHRRTYVGAMPGRIIKGIKDANTRNPVFMLDEIDKVGADFRGDPSSALLEALDPEQNSAFSDHYLEVPFDLSEVIFITTANILETIPPALRDRLEVIRFSGYTHDEKYEIARKFLLEKALSSTALDKKEIELDNTVLKKVISHYTREAGVRNLEREILKIMRKTAKKIAEGKIKKVKITTSNLSKFLGPVNFNQTLAEKKDEIGISTGLAWTEAGGEILFIEVALMPGKGRLILTGKLGEVMQESCKAALSYIRSHFEDLGLSKKFYDKYDFHIHVPEGAVKKDGPSAGVTITTALVSALTGKPAKRGLGMTGEITLRGRVLEIGGLKEKVIAGHQAGLKEIILPKDNKKDLVDVPKKIQKEIKFHFVSSLDEVLALALRS